MLRPGMHGDFVGPQISVVERKKKEKEKIR